MCFYQCGGNFRLQMNALILVWQLLLVVVMMMQKNLALELLGVFWNSSLPPLAFFPIVVAPLLLTLASLPLCTDETMQVFLLVRFCCSQDIVFFPLRGGGSNIAFSFWHQSLTRMGEYQRSFYVDLAIFCKQDDRTASPNESNQSNPVQLCVVSVQLLEGSVQPSPTCCMLYKLCGSSPISFVFLKNFW